MTREATVAVVVACLAVAAAVVAGLGGANTVESGDAPQPVIPDEERVPVEAVAVTDESETVRVGVIGTAFDRSNPALRGRVAAINQLGGPRLLSGPSDHGTAVAEIVAERSPAADLYLASVGRAPTPERYARAVDWLLAQDVDVIVDAGSYFPRTATGLDRIERAARRAAEEGIAVVTSAGNYATRHWRGTPREAGWVQFADGVGRNRLSDGSISGRVTLRLYWQGSADYDLYLYRRVANDPDELVAASRRETGGAEAIDTVVPEGEYYVRVYAESGGGVPLDLFAASHRLTHTSRRGSSLPPATVESVIAVGATAEDGERRYSSAGRDVTAPDGFRTTAAGRFAGSSAATPVVAGTVSTIIATDRDLTPSQIQRILTETADGSADRIDPDGAIRRVRNGSAGRTPTATAPDVTLGPTRDGGPTLDLAATGAVSGAVPRDARRFVAG